MAVWAGVIRVSFVGARGGESFHADAEQRADIERAVASMPGATLDLLPAELDVSGGLPLAERPSLLLAVQGVEQGRYAGIVVAYLSRLGRNVREQLAVWDRVEQAGGRIVVVREGIDTSTPHGRLQRTLLLAMAEHEREVHAERFEVRRRLATEAGIWQRRQVPLGYRRGAGRRLEPDPATAPRVVEAFAARARGDQLVRIADRLAMTPSGARQLLANRVYLGELRVGQHVNPAAHPPLVSERQFAAAQAVVATRGGRRDRPPALLAGLVVCASCGHRMPRTRAGGPETYSCPVRHSAGRCPRPAVVTLDRLDTHVERVALAHLRVLQGVAVADDRGDVEGELRDARAELAAYLEGVQAAGLSPEDWADGARLRRERVDAARDALRAREREASAVPSGDVGELWGLLDHAQRNRLLRSVLEAVVVRPVGRGRRVAVADRAVVLAAGAGVVVAPVRGGRRQPVAGVVVPADDDPAVLRVDLAEE